MDPADAAARAAVLASGTGLSSSRAARGRSPPSRRRGAATRTVHDLDHRPEFWPSAVEAGRWTARPSPRHVAVGNADEVAIAVGGLGPGRSSSSDALLDLGPSWPS